MAGSFRCLGDICFKMAALSKLCVLQRANCFLTGLRRMSSHSTVITSTPQSQLPRSLGHVPHHKSNSVLWWIGNFIMPTAVALAYYNAFYLHDKEKRPEFVPYAHMRLRKKPFPWGDGNHSLLHHPYHNALPQGYETDDDGNPMPAGTYWQGNYTIEEGYPNPEGRPTSKPIKIG